MSASEEIRRRLQRRESPFEPCLPRPAKEPPAGATVTRAFNASFTEAVQRDNSTSATRTLLDRKAMKSIAMVCRATVYEAIALAVFAGIIVLFVHAMLPFIGTD